MVQGIARFNTFKPAEQFLPSDGSPLVYFCCIPTEDRKSLSGTFRVAIRAKKPLSIDFDIKRLFGEDLMPGYSCNLTRRTDDFVFHNNCWYSEYSSFNQDVEAGRIKFTPLAANPFPMSDDEIQAKARAVFTEKDNPGCFRLEVTVGPNNKYIAIKVRFVPAIKSVCKDNSYLRGPDVLSMDVCEIRGVGFKVNQMDPQRLADVPFGPVVFFDPPVLSDEQYIVCGRRFSHIDVQHEGAHPCVER